jgi:hypothetical protein
MHKVPSNDASDENENGHFDDAMRTMMMRRVI